MLRNKFSYYLVSNQFMLLNEKAYDLIKKHIKIGTVSKFNDVIYLEYACKFNNNDIIDIFRNGIETTRKNACETCKFRLKSVSGNCGFKYQPLKDKTPDNFEYLKEKCSELGIKEDIELLNYFYMAEYPDEYNEFQGEDMTFKEYKSMAVFLNGLEKTISGVSRLNGFFKKIFR